MPFWLKTLGIAASMTVIIGSVSYLTIADKWGSIFVILALIIALLKQVIAFIGFLTAAIKFLIIFVFIAILIGVGLMAFRTFKKKQKPKE
jgi:hypothetical protein